VPEMQAGSAMMGPTHSLSSAVAWLAVATPLSHYGHHLTPATVAVGTVVAAGAGLLPDLDHHSGTIANAFGFFTRVLCRVVAFISGGHRHATHSLLGTGVFVALAVAATHNVWALTTTVWLCMGLGVRALWHRPRNRPNGKLDWRDVAGLVHAVVAFGAAYWVTHSGTDLSVIPWAVAVGYLAHLLGDSMTEQGVNWLWPSPRRYRIASIDTGKSVEKRVVIPGLYVALAAIVYTTHSTWVPALLHTIS
jgi:membrane-bound metal-dependent hydrolase YbcI (DUF457 family)